VTAEVIVMNRLGVGIAADSAVTLGAGGAAKIYTSADKLFQLSERAPVGILIYGSASLLGVPWETIVKVYRLRLGDKVFDSLEGYAADFITFLGSNRTLFSAQVQNKYLLDFALSYYVYLLGRLKADLKGLAAKGTQLTKAVIGQCLRDLVDREIVSEKKSQRLDMIQARFEREIVAKHRTSIEKAKKRVLGKLPRSRSVDSNLTDLIGIALTRRRRQWMQSGIVVTGFGERQHFPTVIEVVVKGIVNNQVLAFPARKRSIGVDSNAYVAPFAQTEMVATFMEGIDPTLKTVIDGEVAKIFRAAAHVIIEEVRKRYPRYATRLERGVFPAIDGLLDHIRQTWEERQRTDYSDPIMDIVASLPKDELAAMSESLVNLTKFKRRVSRQLETVGGPIDVAVITKGDGFVWVKRKHYFKAELNPRVLSRYSTGG
jgi:hypothetical protein